MASKKRHLFCGAALVAISSGVAFGGAISIVPDTSPHFYFSSIIDSAHSTNSQVVVSAVPLSGTDTITGVTPVESDSTVYNLSSTDLNFQFADSQLGTDFTTSNSGTIYFSPATNTPYALSGSFSGLGTGLGAENFGVNLTQIIVQGSSTYYEQLFASSGVNGSLANPSANAFPSESGNLSGELYAGDTYFLSYQTGALSAASNGFVDLTTSVPEPVSSALMVVALTSAGMVRPKKRRVP